MKKILPWILGLILFPAAGFGLEGFYLGAQLGEVGLSGGAAGSYSNAIGFGADIGIRTNPVLDVVLRSQHSAHAGATGLSLWSNTLSADYMVGSFNDIDFFLGAGPGIYLFNTDVSDAKFGLHGETHADLSVGDNLKLGLGFRLHGIFAPLANEGSFWTVMMRVGFFFGSGN